MKEDKFYESGKEEEHKTHDRLQVFRMDDDLCERVHRLGSEIKEGCELVEPLAVLTHDISFHDFLDVYSALKV